MARRTIARSVSFALGFVCIIAGIAKSLGIRGIIAHSSNYSEPHLSVGMYLVR